MAPVTVTHYQPKPSSSSAACQVPLGCGARRFTTDPTQVFETQQAVPASRYTATRQL